MISSIEFTTGKYGYVNAKVMKPVRPSIRDIGPRPFSHRNPEETKKKLEEWNEKKRMLSEQYEKELAEYNKTKGGYENPYLAKCLINRKFRFSDNRVNVIVGPNGCGKSTIIRAIAAYAGCGLDGFPVLKEPSMLNYVITGASTEADYDDQIEKTIVQEMKNPCKIDWDGTPVYFHNFNARLERAGSTFGSIQRGGGGFITNCAEEAEWHINKGRMCGGERAVYMLQNLYEIVRGTVCYDELFAYDSKRVNDVWMNTFEAQRRHYGKFRNFSVKKPCTLLLDELDQNFDIATNIQLYGEFLPMLIERTGIQIITVSHSPIVLSDAVFNSDRYNVISIDDEYTSQCRENLSDMFKVSDKATGKKVKHIFAEDK